MVCTTIRPTVLPYPDLEDWQKCSKFVGEHLNYEPLEVPALIVSRKKKGKSGVVVGRIFL